MVDRGLLYREWKQNQVVILLSIAFLVLANPLSIVNTYLSYQGCLDRQDPQYCDFIVNYSISNLIDLNWVPGCHFGGLLPRNGTFERHDGFYIKPSI